MTARLTSHPNGWVAGGLRLMLLAQSTSLSGGAGTLSGNEIKPSTDDSMKSLATSEAGASTTAGWHACPTTGLDSSKGSPLTSEQRDGLMEELKQKAREIRRRNEGLVRMEGLLSTFGYGWEDTAWREYGQSFYPKGKQVSDSGHRFSWRTGRARPMLFDTWKKAMLESEGCIPWSVTDAERLEPERGYRWCIECGMECRWSSDGRRWTRKWSRGGNFERVVAHYGYAKKTAPVWSPMPMGWIELGGLEFIDRSWPPCRGRQEWQKK